MCRLLVLALSLPLVADHRPRGVPVEGGPVAPDGVTEVAIDLPAGCRTHNAPGRNGLGLCVYTSVQHAALWQNEPRLWDFQERMRSEPGGGYPHKLDAMMAKYAPGVRYVQHVGGDPEFLWRAVRSGRLPSVTYCGLDPHYGPRRIAHMVNLVHLDPPEKSPRWACVLDCNFPGERQLVWLTFDEFLDRWRCLGGGWAIVLLNPPPPPVPHN